MTDGDMRSPRPGHVFISYSRRDSSVADAVYERLEHAGVAVWLDRRSIRPGMNYAEEIFRAISEASAVVLLLSETANESREIHREIQLASSANVPIIPVRLESVTYHPALAYYLSATQWIEGTSDMAQAMTALVRHVGGSNSVVTSAEREPDTSGLSIDVMEEEPASGPTEPPSEELAEESSPTRQDLLSAAILAHFPDGVVKSINKLPWFYIHIPSIHPRWGTHLAVNTSKPKIHFDFYARDDLYANQVARQTPGVERHSTGLRLAGHPKFDTVDEAAEAAVGFLRLLQATTRGSNLILPQARRGP